MHPLNRADSTSVCALMTALVCFLERVSSFVCNVRLLVLRMCPTMHAISGSRAARSMHHACSC